MSPFQDLDKTRFQDNVELQDRESMFYADCAKLLWASALGLV